MAAATSPRIVDPLLGLPITIRLVKGVHWNTETVKARAEGWPVPVYERKAKTDANYERCARLPQDHHGVVRAAFGSHSLRSLAYPISEAVRVASPTRGTRSRCSTAWPSARTRRSVASDSDFRVCAPVGELVPGTVYLVRSLLENTNNDHESGKSYSGHRVGARLGSLGENE